MKANELAQIGNISLRHAYYIIRGERRASIELAERLEEKTGISAEAWLWPEKYPNKVLCKNKVEAME